MPWITESGVTSGPQNYQIVLGTTNVGVPGAPPPVHATIGMTPTDAGGGFNTVGGGNATQTATGATSAITIDANNSVYSTCAINTASGVANTLTQLTINNLPENGQVVLEIVQDTAAGLGGTWTVSPSIGVTGSALTRRNFTTNVGPTVNTDDRIVLTIYKSPVPAAGTSNPVCTITASLHT